MPCDREQSPRFRPALTAILILGILPFSIPAAAQERFEQDPDKQTAPRPPDNAIDRWNQMSPEERERELAKLPPARAKLIRQRIQRYNQMHPEEQQQLRERYQTFSQLPPDKKQLVRTRWSEFRQLPPARRPLLHREIQQLRQMPDAQRQARLNSEDFHSRFSPPEQQIIRDLSTYLPK